MTKWEYMYVVAIEQPPHDWHPVTVNGKEFEKWKFGRGFIGPDLHEFLNQLGQEGWELVSAAPYYEQIRNYLLILKRPCA